MSTTNLFVELIVIGIGAAFWVVFVILSIFNYTWVPFDKLMSLPAIVPGLSVIYVLGIVVDRLADWVFHFRAESLCLKWFRSLEEYYTARTLIYTRSESLRELFEYSRSRLRICRGWVINCILIVCGLNLFIWFRLSPSDGRLKLSIFGSLSLGLFALGAWHAWYGLASNEYRRLLEQSTLLKREQTIPKGNTHVV
jgi:hypothetical protein